MNLLEYLINKSLLDRTNVLKYSTQLKEIELLDLYTRINDKSISKIHKLKYQKKFDLLTSELQTYYYFEVCGYEKSEFSLKTQIDALMKL
ncbi:MAG: hypothetical protein ACOCRK_03740, partial [bacterium]